MLIFWLVARLARILRYALKVRRIVAEQLNIEYERVYPESSFVNDLGATNPSFRFQIFSPTNTGICSQRVIMR